MACQQGKKIISPLQYSGTMYSELFEFWFEEMLLPQIPLGTVIVMDNASFHRKKNLIKIAEAKGMQVIFLPPYSPELNPIEHFWNQLKNQVRENLLKSPSLDYAIYNSFQKF